MHYVGNYYLPVKNSPLFLGKGAGTNLWALGCDMSDQQHFSICLLKYYPLSICLDDLLVKLWCLSLFLCTITVFIWAMFGFSESQTLINRVFFLISIVCILEVSNNIFICCWENPSIVFLAIPCSRHDEMQNSLTDCCLHWKWCFLSFRGAP